MNPTQPPNIAEQIIRLGNGYRSRLPAEFAELTALAEGLVRVEIGGETARSNLEQMHVRLHKLAGSGGTFGLTDLSVVARSLEYQAKVLLSGTPGVTLGYDEFVAGVKGLGSLMTGLSLEVDKPKPVVTIQSLVSSQSLTLWLIEDDVELGQELVRQLAFYNYAVHLFYRVDAAEKFALTASPDILIMDVNFDHEKVNTTSSLHRFPNLHKLNCPLVFISGLDDFRSRVRAARLGADGYFLKPLDLPRLVNRLVQIFERRHAPSPRVMIVDDDIVLATRYQLVLQGAGMEVEVLQKVTSIIERIANFRPDMVLMDMNMPEYTGSDLAGVIRQYDNWGSLPIVYLSAETDLSKQINALDKGADDFLTKPISDMQLIAAVRVRVQRARQLESQISRDSLTGLLKHASIKEAIEIEVLRSRRAEKPATVAMLDIDHFKNVNDLYGHAVGDIVISAVGILLRQRLRQSDIIGRYGGEEFAVVLPGCDAQTAYKLLDDLRQRFAAIKFSHEGKILNCSISIGLACSAQFLGKTGAELLALADSALYVAKKGGRNQVQEATIEQVGEK